MEHFLVLSSDKKTSSRIEGILKGSSYDVRIVTREIALLNEAKTIKPELILAELNIKGIDGLEICRFVSSGKIWRENIPVILITNMNHSIVLDEFSAAAGAKAIIYLEESTDEEIKNIIQRVLEDSGIDSEHIKRVISILLIDKNRSSNRLKTMLEREGMKVKVVENINEIGDFDFTVAILNAEALRDDLLKYVHKIKQLDPLAQEIVVNCNDIPLSTLNQLIKLKVFKILDDDYTRIGLLKTVLSADRIYRLEHLRDEYERQNQMLLRFNQELDILLHTTNELFMKTSLKEVLSNAVGFSKNFFPGVLNVLFMKEERSSIRSMDTVIKLSIPISAIESGSEFIEKEQRLGKVRIAELSSEGMRYISKSLHSLTRFLILVELSNKGVIFGYLLLAFKDLKLNGREISFLDYYATQVSLAIEHVTLLEKVTELSRIDGVTGINNRRYFEELYKRDFERAKRYRHPLSVIMIDVNDFKLINDTFGHSVGDEVLYTIGQIIKSNTRESDTVGRYGGDEFCIVMNETERDGAVNKMNRLKEAISALPLMKGKDDALKLSISAGVATYPQDAKDPEELLRIADSKMYEDKKRYKNHRGGYVDRKG